MKTNSPSLPPPAAWLGEEELTVQDRQMDFPPAPAE